MALGLRTRFTLWFGLAALVPIAGAAWFTREKVSDVYRGEYERTLAQADADAAREVKAIQEGVGRTLRGLASRDSQLVGGLLQSLRTRGGELGTDELTELRRRAPSTMRALGLDLLMIVARDGTVLASPHHPGLEDRREALPRRLAAEKPGAAVVLREKALRDGAPVPVLVMAAALTMEEGGAEVTVLVGREFAPQLAASLHRDGVVEARVTDATGAAFARTETDWARLAGGPAVDKPLPGVDAAPAAHLYVAVPDDDLRRALRDVTMFAGALGLLALAGAVLLGFAVSRRITRDLDALVEGAGAIARGDLDHKVAVRGRDEVGEVAAAFNAMTDELRESKERLVRAEREAAWREIARAIAHEIKNPLTPIQMSVETTRKAWAAKHPSFHEIFEESTRTILEEVQRLKRIVSEFSQFARMPRPALQAVDLDDVVAGALALYKGSVKVISELAGGLPPVSADRDQLTQVVLNLLENARDAVASRGSDQSVGRITVRTSARDGVVTLEVEDNGPGFDPAIRDKLFTPYFTTKATGTGLGLAIVRRIVTEHGGRIGAHSEPGKGARFVVELPAGPAASAVSS